MPPIKKTKGSFSVTAYRGDAKALLAFDLPKSEVKQLAGFTIEVKPAAGPAYYLLNTLQFKRPADHAQDPTLPPNASVNAPFHKFRWVHVPGQAHQGIAPSFGDYTYTVTPRYFDENASMVALDRALSVSVKIEVAPYVKGKLALGFTRGFVQSQAFVRHFGKTAKIRPAGRELLFDTSVEAGTNASGHVYTYAEQYNWLGFTAQDRIFSILDEVAKDKSLRLDAFAYDLSEPDLVRRFQGLAKQGRLRLILDDAALHHSVKKPTPEDAVADLLEKAKAGTVTRGKFARYAHDKVFVVRRKDGTAVKVLTGSTNFSVTGLYVNSNHVLVFDDAKVAAKYAEVFDTAWDDDVRAAAFRKSALATGASSFSGRGVPRMEVTFSPHDKAEASRILSELSERIEAEGKPGTKSPSVLFAVMQVDNSDSPVYETLKTVHANEKIFSYGISDTKSGIELYSPKSARGVLTTGKPQRARLPKPFSDVPGVGLGHQVHHKFVVCGFNRPDAVVFCGSSNLASGGEVANGDNLLAIRDSDVATVFAIEALALVDHFEFLDRLGLEQAGGKSPGKKPAKAVTSKSEAAIEASWFLSTGDGWTKKYYDPKDLRCVDRKLFAG